MQHDNKQFLLKYMIVYFMRILYNERGVIFSSSSGVEFVSVSARQSITLHVL